MDKRPSTSHHHHSTAVPNFTSQTVLGFRQHVSAIDHLNTLPKNNLKTWCINYESRNSLRHLLYTFGSQLWASDLRLSAEEIKKMACNAGPPQGELKWMTPYPIANDPPTPKPIPDVVHPTKSPAERASQRFSLAGKRAIGMPFTISFHVHH